MHTKVKSGAVEAFPYGLRELMRDNPNTSFPKVMSDAALAAHGVYPVTPREIPQPFDAITQNATVIDPVFNGEHWVQEWDITPATSEQVGQRTSELEKNVRSQRNNLLAATDYFALTDVEIPEAVAAYRQALRDITAHPSFPHLTEADWPTKPA